MTVMTSHIPEVQTDRLTLRAPRLTDLPALAAFFATDRSGFVGGPTDEMGSFTKLTARIGHWALKGFGLWHVERRDTQSFVGWAGLICPPGWEEPELGWTVFDGCEGKGIAFEAAQAARTCAATDLGLNGVISYIRPDNTRSANLAKRLGATFEREGTLMGVPCHIYRHPKEAA